MFKKIYHYLFKCPTFWEIKPHFQCPDCGKRYRCYWDGHDTNGKVDVCNKCNDKYEKLLKGEPL